jgi:Fe2+ transport system protein FeoA
VTLVTDRLPPDVSPRRAGAVSLAELAPGTTAVLRHVTDTQSRDVLRSLGLVTGASLRLCRVGDPCIIQVRSTRIGLSKVVAQSVYVALDAGAEP